MSEIDHELPSFQRPMLFAEQGPLDARLQQLAIMTASMMLAENCSIMLAEQGSDAVPHLNVWACTGALSPAAWKESAAAGSGVAGHVFATGDSLMIDDIRWSPFADCARQLADQHPSLLCVPIRVNAAAVGVVNVSGRHAQGPFAGHELRLLDMIALFIGKSIQVSQLQSMLDSRFAQMAVIQETTRGLGQSLAAGLPNPDQVAKIMAKSFYKEMTRAGFGARQIINAASEIITQLSGNLQRHSRRLRRDTADVADDMEAADDLRAPPAA